MFINRLEIGLKREKGTLLGLGPRDVEKRMNLIHPVHQQVSVVAWEVIGQKKLTLNNTEKLDLHNHLRKKVQPKIDPNMKLGKPIEISPWRSTGAVQAHG